MTNTREENAAELAREADESNRGPGPYRVDEVAADDGAPVGCSGCGWTGKARDVAPIDGCALTAGDPSPVGRCPECDSLAYVVGGIYDAAPDLLAALKALCDAISIQNAPLHPAHPQAPEFNVARATIARAEGRT